MICKNFIAPYSNGLKQPLHLNYIFQENVIEIVCNLKCKNTKKVNKIMHVLQIVPFIYLMILNNTSPESNFEL